MPDLRLALEVTTGILMVAFFVATCFWERAVDGELAELNASVAELEERFEGAVTVLAERIEALEGRNA